MTEPLPDPDEALLGSGYPVDDPELEAVLAAAWQEHLELAAEDA